jgi:hypothetical protein
MRIFLILIGQYNLISSVLNPVADPSGMMVVFDSPSSGMGKTRVQRAIWTGLRRETPRMLHARSMSLLAANDRITEQEA